MTTTQSWTEELVEVAGARTQVLKGGSGDPLLVLHTRGGGLTGWRSYHEALSQHFTVYAPSHPGFYKSERPPWVSTVTDVAHFYLGLMQALGLERVSLVGFELGGWIAAEIASISSEKVRGQVLVSALGIKPRVGEIVEMLMVSPETLIDLAYHDVSKAPVLPELSEDEQNVNWKNREMVSRLCWRPYMHNPNLPEYLKFVRVPSLIVWGRQDKMVPLECGEIYNQSLQGSTLHVVEECGHAPQNEKPEEFLNVALSFLSKLS